MIIKGGEISEIIIIGSGGSGEGSSLSVESGKMAIEGEYGGSSGRRKGMLGQAEYGGLLNDEDWDNYILEHGEREEVALTWWLKIKIRLRHYWNVIKRRLGFKDNHWTFTMYDSNNKKLVRSKVKRVRINFKNM